MVKNRFSKVPGEYRDQDIHQWVDYLELICILHKDRELGLGDIADRLQLEVQDAKIDFFSEEDMVNSSAERDDSLEQAVADYWRVIEYRAAVYKEYYPFQVKTNIVKCFDDLSDKQKLYIFFTVCSSLTFFTRQEIYFLTLEFEMISVLALERYLSPKARVFYFGANKTVPEAYQKFVRYEGHIFDKIEKLAKDLELTLAVQRDAFSPHDYGDGGLDIVAWYHFEDNRKSRFIFLGQCKCSPSWPDDKFSSSSQAWGAKIHFQQELNNINFIPFCYRQSNGDWFLPHLVSYVILIDRLRLIECLGGDTTFFSNSLGRNIIDNLLNERETTV